MPVTVLQILPALDVGGVERGTLEIAKGLIDRQHRSVVVSAGGKLVKQLEMNGSKHIALDIGKKSLLTMRHIPTLKKIILENNINIIHVRSRMPAWIAYLTWKSLVTEKKPMFISTVHGYYSVNPYSKIMMKAQKIIAISTFIKDYILKKYPDVDPDIISVIHRGIDKQIYNPSFSIQADWQCPWAADIKGENKYVITLPARVTPRKGQMDFIEIIRLLVQRGQPVHGVIAGAPHKRRQHFYHKLKEKIRDYDLTKHFSLIGHRDDMKQVMKASNMIVSLSKIPEAFGRTTLEALSLGTPVVGYDHGGTSEILNVLFPQGQVQPNNIEAASDRLNELIHKDIIIKQDHPFCLERMINETIQIYESC